MSNTELDFSKAKRGPVLEAPGKTRITIMIDDDVLAVFRERAEAAGKGYQTMINESLRKSLDPDSEPLSVRMLKELVGAGTLHIAIDRPDRSDGLDLFAGVVESKVKKPKQIA